MLAMTLTSVYLGLTLMQTNWHSPCGLAGATKKAERITLNIQHMPFVCRYAFRSDG